MSWAPPVKKAGAPDSSGDDMCRFVAINGAKGGNDLRQRQRIGGVPLVTGNTVTCFSNKSLITDCSFAVKSSPP